MKIAFLGNMNNNNFSLMRYFRDLGADAHLLLWDNDGKGSLSHFSPDSDTLDIKRWDKYIHQTTLLNAFSSVLGDPRKFKLPESKDKIISEIGGYDAYIGSGIAPALLQRANINLDIFYPYSTGVEFVGIAPNSKSISSETLFRRFVLYFLRQRQIAGIKKARFCLNAELGHTQLTLDSIRKDSLPYAIPMVYNREVPNNDILPSHLVELQNKIKNYDLRILTHCRQLWYTKKGYTDSDWPSMNKNNQWLIQAFSKLLAEKKDIKPVLIILEYGPDLSYTKELCIKLGIQDHVIWLPTMPRKDIMFVLSQVDIGVGEFTVFPGCIWGGSGWEVLASGKPLLQTFNFSKSDYISKYKVEPPKILDVKSENDVYLHLLDWYKDKERFIKMGSDNKQWFDENGGIGLAKKWLDLLMPTNKI